MLSNYLKIAFRQIRRQNLYSLVNLFGLTVSIACSILLFLFLRNEFSYDRFHKDFKSIYRVTSEANINGNDIHSPTTPPALATAMKDELTCRIFTQSGSVIGVYDRIFYDNYIYAVDPSFFEIFTFKVIQGSKNGLLSNDNEIVLTESLSQKLFGEEDPIGKKVKYNKGYKIVKGIITDPGISHLNFTGLVRYEPSSSWVSFSAYTYLKTSKTRVEIENRLDQIYNEHVEPLFTANNSTCTFHIQALKDIHLKSNLQGELDINGNLTINYAFVLVGLFMLIVAGINYTNMVTARSLKRAKEIGIRKAIGSYRMDLIRQFLVESMLLVFFGVFLSLIAVDLVLPYLKFLIEPGMSQIDTMDWQLILFVLFIVFIVGMAGGLYPAFYMARFNAAEILNGTFKDHSYHLTARRFLITVQFAISILLVICTWIVMSQMRYINEKNIGYNKNHLLIIAMPESSATRYGELLEHLMKLDQVKQIGSGELVPGMQNENLSTFTVQQGNDWRNVLAKYFAADQGFIQSLDISLLAGNNINDDQKGANLVLVNETFAKNLSEDYNEIIGANIRLPFRNTRGLNQSTIAGVISDFHFKSLHTKIQPLIILNNRINPYLIVQLNEGSEIRISDFRSAFNDVYPDAPFDYHFADEKLKNLYNSDILIGKIFGLFAIVTSVLALLGIFALSFYTSELRKKEIGIRKINGASIKQILFLVSREYILMVLIASILSWPFAYYIINSWLEGFEYRINIRPEIFILTLLAALIVTLATVSLNSLKAARSNIVTVLNKN